MLSERRISQFKELYQRHYGVALDDKSALEKAEAVLAMFRAVYRPIPKDSPFLTTAPYEREQK